MSYKGVLMIELGKIQELEVLRHTSIGVYLNESEDSQSDDILLPRKRVPEGIQEGDKIEVFVYRDSEDRLIATTLKPKILLGEIARLDVVDINKIGAFLDWGLEKDLFLPFKEQTEKISKGKSYFVSLYIDKSDRLCATMKIYNLLTGETPYNINDTVKGKVYNINPKMGAFVAIDMKYHGFIPLNEMYANVVYGATVEGRVVGVREDGKLNLSMRKKAYIQMDDDCAAILEKLNENANGILYLNDKSTPQEIKYVFDMSKNAFKRAVGRLLKQKKIEFIEDGIKLIK